MQDYLKHYQMRITAQAPIHIGDGTKLGKKEYIRQGSRVIVPDTGKMFRDLQLLHLDKAYAEFVLSSSYGYMDLGWWLKEKGIMPQRIDGWKLYSMDAGDAFTKKPSGKGGTPKEILAFTKDPYGLPYVPGSSIKGMLRTAIICWRIHNNQSLYASQIKALIQTTSLGGKGKSFLKRQIDDIETAVLHTLARTDRRGNAVNSIMSGFIVSDSKPLPLTQLTLAQKIDYTLNRQEKPLPILREALKPGSQIDFELTIDTNICNITIEEVFAALDYFQQISFDSFYAKFGRGSKAKGTVWLGGGTGFLSKTIIYPACGTRALTTTDKVFYSTIGKNYTIHKHTADIKNGVAPHVCKCTRYGGQLYDMGMGKIELIY